MASSLDDFVREHRMTIAVVFPVVGAALLVGSAEGHVPAALAFNPALMLFGVLVMRLPVVAALAPLVTRCSIAWLGLLVAYTYAIEWVGITTGWPYGAFAYSIDLGPMLGGVPIALPVFFIPLVVNAYLLAGLLVSDRRLSLPLAVVFVLAIDLVLDPAAVGLGFWAYETGGYYGVPVSNYLGWLLSGTVGVVAIDRAFDRSALRARLEAAEFALDDLVSFVLLWGAVNALYGHAIPVVLVLGFGVGLIHTGQFDLPRVRMILTRRAF